MLEELLVKDFALIDALQVQFSGGLTILTGETGAGKSIIVGALSFILGGKADVGLIRSGMEEASVSAVVGIDSRNLEALDWLDSHSIAVEDERVILRRTLRTNGRGACYIQNVPVTRADLADFTSFLFDLHGQHEHQALLRMETHRRYLDRFAGIEDEVDDFSALFYAVAEKRSALDSLREAERNREERIELLRFAMEEIDAASPRTGETRELEEESTKLASYEKLAQGVSAANALLHEDEGSVLNAFRRACGQLDNVAALDASLQGIAQRLSDLFYEVEDAADALRKYHDSLAWDPDRLERIQERLSDLYRLKKKYGADEDAVLAYRAKAEQDLAQLERSSENQALLKAEISKLEKDLLVKASILSEKRRAAAHDLANRITAILSTLGMAKAQFAIGVNAKLGAQGTRSFSQWGADDVEFRISANLGEPLKELTKIASGGELSRVMLAVKTILAGSDMVETLVFDEIDTGIGGEVALAVGKHLSAIGKEKQLFCITHLASIAVRADNHLRVEKFVEGGRTVTRLVSLGDEQRRQEIARMLAGDAADGAALAHADELLAKYSARSEAHG